MLKFSRNFIRRILIRSWLIVYVRRILSLTSPKRRELNRQRHERLDYYKCAIGSSLQTHAPKSSTKGVVTFNSSEDVDATALQSIILASFKKAGYELCAILSSRTSGWMEDTLRLFGVDKFVYYDDFLDNGSHPELEKLWQKLIEGRPILDLTYQGSFVGKYALSTFMRQTRNGDPDIKDTNTALAFRELLQNALHYTDAVVKITAAIKPTAALVADRGYSPQGQLFDCTINNGHPCFTWNGAHSNQVLMFKRYSKSNLSDHHSTLSETSWLNIKNMPWTEKHWNILSDEYFRNYKSGEWASAGGSQVDKMFLSISEVKDRLRLNPTKKTAFVFSQIFWDGTFFWGTDLFRNYEDWFRQTVMAACANDRVNWVIKVHPANVMKDKRDGVSGEHSEMQVIRELMTTLPPHVQVLEAVDPISTYTLFPVMDYCITVRGTAGIEAACRGIPVITAGTGRYDRKGFTVDPDTSAKYLELLSSLQDIEPLSEPQTELARRFSYGIFYLRPTKVTSFNFGYGKDSKASLYIDCDSARKKNPYNASDIRSLAQWIEGGEEDFLNLPLSLKDTPYDHH
jgi:hypothetical protein